MHTMEGNGTTVSEKMNIIRDGAWVAWSGIAYRGGLEFQKEQSTMVVDYLKEPALRELKAWCT